MSHSVAAVVLTYNSSEDLPDCLVGLAMQRGCDLKVIVVDNASCPKERANMEENFAKALPRGQILEASGIDFSTTGVRDAPALFLRNDENSGYSAGNNIGARVADALGCTSALIINPDVRLDTPDYVATLSALILANPNCAVAASAVRNLSGTHENPMREPGFGEELLWPVSMVLGRFLRRHKPARMLPSAPFRVEKISGACFMIRLDFLREIGFFDQSVFLYCEESILMAQVRASGWHMVMDPTIKALHAHQTNSKGDPRPRFRLWAKSRRYFHRCYSTYSAPRRAALEVSRTITMTLVHLRTFAKSLRG